MAERKEPSRNNWVAQKESELLEGVSWASWRPILANRLAEKGLLMPNSDEEEILHEWFILRHLRKLGKINEDDFRLKKENLFKDKDEIFDDQDASFALRFITEKTEKLMR